MSNIVRFGNPGNINPKVWSVFGVSAKLNDNSIGRFGTGLKYAIAVLLREGRKINIRSGNDWYKFTTKKIVERGKEFEQVLCNGEEMPYTTHLGEGWELWQAYRELYSNCLDEGGQLDYRQSDELIEAIGYTAIEAELGDIDHNSIFLETKHMTCLSSSGLCDVYKGESEWIYYKGIRCMKLDKKAKFTYNILNADLTEDRTFKYFFQVDQGIAASVLGSRNKDFIADFFFQTKDYFEERVRFEYSGAVPTEIVLNMVKENMKNNVWMHTDMKVKVKHYIPDEGFTKIEIGEREALIIDKAKDFCDKIGHKVKYPIHVSDDLGTGKLAVADRRDNTIYLSPRVLTMGLKQVVSTVFEENMHLQYGLNDCNYETQNWLFDQVITMGEKLTGEIL